MVRSSHGNGFSALPQRSLKRSKDKRCSASKALRTIVRDQMLHVHPPVQVLGLFRHSGQTENWHCPCYQRPQQKTLCESSGIVDVRLASSEKCCWNSHRSSGKFALFRVSESGRWRIGSTSHAIARSFSSVIVSRNSSSHHCRYSGAVVNEINSRDRLLHGEKVKARRRSLLAKVNYIYMYITKASSHEKVLDVSSRTQVKQMKCDKFTKTKFSLRDNIPNHQNQK